LIFFCLFFLFSIIFLTGCQFGEYEIIIKKVSSDEKLAYKIVKSPDKFNNSHVELSGDIIFTQTKEWVKLNTCSDLYIKKATPMQTFEYGLPYAVTGIVKIGSSPFGQIVYIEADSILNKTEFR